MKFTDMNLASLLEDANDNEVLTMAFVNVQPLTAVYDTERGFCCGTIFPNINKPLEVGGCM